MEELLELRNCIEEERYSDALFLVEEMEEMSKEDKINKIYSYSIILLLHLIKQEAEQRSTRSWGFSIAHSIEQIARTNKRRKSGGLYLPSEELLELLEEAYPLALKKAAIEAFEGEYTEEELGNEIDKSVIQQQAMKLIQERISSDT